MRLLAHIRGGAICDVGRVPRGTDRIDAAVAADLAAAGVRSRACENVMARKYGKLLTNLGNVIEAASGAGGYRSDLSERARAEGVAAYAAASRWHPDYKDEFAEFLTLDAPFRR